MGEDENVILLFGLAAGLFSAFMLSTSRLHEMFTRDNPGVGLHRIAVLFTLAWTGYVIAFHGDASIRGIYVLFYLVLAYAAVKGCGQLLGPRWLGFDVRREVLVRGNRPIGLFTASFALATGLIAGGSLWGEADPLSDDEGGWWIPAAFFAMGWAILVVSTKIYARRGGRLPMQLRREHDMAAARTAAMFVFSTTAVILPGVAGDFWGWQEGLLSMGTIALMLIGHELLVPRGDGGAQPVGQEMVMSLRELLEHTLYVALAVSCWWLNRVIAHGHAIAAGGA